MGKLHRHFHEEIHPASRGVAAHTTGYFGSEQKLIFQFPCLPKPLKTPLFTLFSLIFPCANAAGQLKHMYKKSYKNIGNLFPSKTQQFTRFSA